MNNDVLCLHVMCWCVSGRGGVSITPRLLLPSLPFSGGGGSKCQSAPPVCVVLCPSEHV